MSALDLLAALREGDRARERVLLQVAQPATVAGFHHWREGELAYVDGAYAKALRAFATFIRSASASTPLEVQLLYYARHRSAFASLQLGRPADCETHTQAAELLIEGHRDVLAEKRADTLAMRAHLRELTGDFDSAVVLFEQAYELANGSEYHGRAATVASDLGRVHEIMGEPRAARDWLKKSNEHAGKIAWKGSELQSRTRKLREAILSATLGEWPIVHTIASEILSATMACDTPEISVDSLVWRARAARELGWLSEAQADLVRAVELASNGRLARHEAYARKDLALALILQGHDDDARDQWRHALALSRTLGGSAAALLLTQLAEDVTVFPLLSGQAVPEHVKLELQSLLADLRDSIRPRAYQGHISRPRTETLVKRLRRCLEECGARSLVLPRDGSVDLTTGIVSGEDGGIRGKLSVALLEVLEVLHEVYPSDISPEAIAARCGNASVQGVKKSLQRLARLLPSNVGQTRRQGTHYWRLLE